MLGHFRTWTPILVDESTVLIRISAQPRITAHLE